jgi:polyisoprenoid-binding protein YceI
MNRPAVAALAALLLAGSAGLALSQPAAKPAGPPQMPPAVTDPAQVPAGHYVTDPHHGGVILKVQHMGMDQSVFRMDKFQAAFDYDPAHPDASKVTATIDANSFNQGDEKISTQFAKEFLDAPNHPEITFNSTKLRLTGKTTGVLTGDLTIGGVTHPVDLNVTFRGFRPAGGMGPARVGFTASGVVRRADFNVGKGMPLGVIGDVDVDMNMEFTKAG